MGPLSHGGGSSSDEVAETVTAGREGVDEGTVESVKLQVEKLGREERLSDAPGATGRG